MIPELEIVCLRVKTFGNAGLIGDDNQEMALSFCLATEIKNAINEFTVFDLENMVLVNIDHAVTIQEKSRMKRLAEDVRLQLALSKGEAFRDADVDKIALRSEETRVKGANRRLEDVLLEGETAGEVGGEDPSADLVNTGINETGRMLGAFFKQGMDATVGNFGSTVAVGIFHMHEDEAEGIVFAGEEELVVIDLDVRIAIEDEGFMEPEEVEGLLDGAAGAEGFGLLGVKDRNAQEIIPEMLFDHLLHERHAEDDLPRISEGDIAQKQLQERDSIDIGHRFRTIRENGAESRAETSRQNHDALRRQGAGTAG